MLGINSLPIDLEARLEARLQRREAEAKAREEKEQSPSLQPIDGPESVKQSIEKSESPDGYVLSENQQAAQSVSKHNLIETNRQVLPDLKVVIATLERDLQADRSPFSNQRTPEIIGDAEPEWIKLLEDILGQLKAIRDALETDISAQVNQHKPEAIFTTRRFLAKMVDGSAMFAGKTATVLSAYMIVHSIDRLFGTGFTSDFMEAFK